MAFLLQNSINRYKIVAVLEFDPVAGIIDNSNLGTIRLLLEGVEGIDKCVDAGVEFDRDIKADFVQRGGYVDRIAFRVLEDGNLGIFGIADDKRNL